MNFLTMLFQALSKMFEAWNTYKERQAGHNEEKLDNLDEIEKRGRDADKIYDADVPDADIDNYLLMRRKKNNPRKLPRI